ncbi:hypothetical protein KZZ52_31770 [Dactylosporangium sp. AC04546]|uniref:hypothetical protein n=1 Tax=Dactylosporangium sp. AC04546 TaxID=2862460 RepID=UPI001EE0803A|nr:hypothetical protein [Dactylosporangium sp. AC04546]WVK78570.1 hypothetical protein KZZ52_31770 [Dactylosporangium sp. AC04546]
MRWSVVAQSAGYGALSATGVLIAGTHVLGVGWMTATGPPDSAVFGLVAGVVIAGLVLPAWAIRAAVTRRLAEWPHTLVLPVLLVMVPAGIAAGGRWQDPWETSLCWAVVALVAHLSVALMIRPGVSVTGRVVPAVALGLLLPATVGVEQAAQGRWLASSLEEKHIPLVAPVAAGYTPSAIGLGDYTLVVRMTGVPGGTAAGRTFTVAIHASRSTASCTSTRLCHPGASGRIEQGADPGDTALRPIGAWDLARLPRISIHGVEPD